MMYPQGYWGKFAGYSRFDYREGPSAWTNDYPRADRFFIQALRRLTRADVRSVEQPVDPFDGDEVFNWPFLYVAGPNHWSFTTNNSPSRLSGSRRLSLGDDFWGPEKTQAISGSSDELFPGGTASRKYADSDPIFHTVFDLNPRYQVPGAWAIIGYLPPAARIALARNL